MEVGSYNEYLEPSEVIKKVEEALWKVEGFSGPKVVSGSARIVDESEKK